MVASVTRWPNGRTSRLYEHLPKHSVVGSVTT
jgi:hypothetical protein